MSALYGTSFEDLEDEERDPVSKKPTAIQDQIATDEKGRKRFHGAFTGGFSAGYFNTVGSKHGWAPSEFRSTRDERAENKRQTAESFMDAEDLGEFGISSRRIRQTKEFSSGSQLAWERSSTSNKQSSTIEGLFAKDLEIAIKPASDSIGVNMLRGMGWRQGRAVGLATIKESKKSRNLCQVDREQITKVAPHWVASAEDEEAIHLTPCEGNKGLGYSGELKGEGLLNEKYGLKSSIIRGKKGKGMSGQAFGVGAFEDEDESVYTSFDLSQYDFSLGSAVPEKNQEVPDSSFVVGHNVLTPRKFYLPPKIPPTFKPNHVIRSIDPSSLPKKMQEAVGTMTAIQRTLFLGENRKDNLEKTRGRKSRWDIKNEDINHDYDIKEREKEIERDEMRSAQRAKRIEYPNDENKQRRFNEFLHYVRRGLLMPQPCDLSHWEWETEQVEFEGRLLSEERALLPDVRARTKPLAKTALALPILDMMRSRFTGETNQPSQISNKDEDRMIAVRSEIFGDKTRHKWEWHPSHGLAKLFNVPNPYPHSSYLGLLHLQNKGKKKADDMLSSIGLPNTAAEFAYKAGMGEERRKDDERNERRRDERRRDREEREEKKKDWRNRKDYHDKKNIKEEDDDEDDHQKENQQNERPPDEFFAAIFAVESSSDENEDEKEDKIKNNDRSSQSIPSIPSTSNNTTTVIPSQEEEIIRIMDIVDDEYGPRPPPGIGYAQELTGFSVLRFNDEVLKKMKKKKRKLEDNVKGKEHKKHKKAKKEKKSKKSKHKKEKKSKSKKRSRSSSSSSSGSSIQALD